MDPNALAGMIFTLLLTVVIGGFIMLFPLARRLGALMEARLEGRKAPPGPDAADVRMLAEMVQSLEAEVRLLTERQEFTEKLLTRREQERLPARE